MAKTSFTGPVYSLNGFGNPIVYITAADTSPVSIAPGAQIVILSPADGGPAATIELKLPKVSTTDGQPFNITNADPRYIGVRGYILNYGAVEHTLIGTDGQPVNGSATGVKIDNATSVEFAGNGNPTAAWAAVQMNLCAAV